MASCAACPDACGKPPTAWAISFRLRARASCLDFPRASSVMAEAHAMAGTHPLARKRISAMRSACIFTASSTMSPQTGFSVRPWASAPGSSPGLRGCSKWSRSWAEYIGVKIVIPTEDFSPSGGICGFWVFQQTAQALREFAHGQTEVPRGLQPLGTVHPHNCRYSFAGSFPLSHSPSVCTGHRIPTKNWPKAAYTALTWSKRIS
jgi:hypothetical protein